MPRKRVAVVGGGVSGLAAAYILAKDGAEVVVYEKDDTLGGHAKTVIVDGTSLDLGFMVFNCVVYPDTMELFENLGGSSLTCHSLYVDELENNPDIDRNETLEHFIQSRGYSELFQKAFLIPTCASIWSCTSGVMSFSAYSMLSFLRNNPTLQRVGCPQRLTPRWHSQSYVNRVKKELESRCCQIRMNSEVYSVLTNDEGCAITCSDGSEEVFDGCIIATQARDALKMLGKQATHDELRILGAFQYAHSDIFLHRDNNLMPKKPAVWSSRNFLGTFDKKNYVTYWLNDIQKIGESGLPFFLTLNPPRTPKSTLFKWSLTIRSRQLLHQKLHMSSILSKEIGSCGSVEHIKAMASLRMESRITSNRWSLPGLKQQLGSCLKVSRTIRLYWLHNMLIIYVLLALPKLATEADFGFPDAYINGDFSFVDKNEGLLNFFLARISKEHHVLEIGCGWGSLALEVVKRTGCRYTGITLSEKQLQYAEQKVKEAGLQDQIQLLLCDYRQLPKGYKYDRIISCEMIEHVGHEFIEEFFKCCESALAENGILVLQFISVADEKYDEFRFSLSFIKEYIFPGECLFSLSRITSAMAAASRLSKIFALGFDSKFMRTWEFYFNYSAAGFKCSIIGNYQVVFVRPGDVAAFGNKPYNPAPGDY
ncbi:UNVERIFIED_CONTAM: Sphingolipid C9-methyltransferase 1 [Sesamum radiatum]|uniref:Sphingolipid C9-methyltransferase 1 n=1 Tax=Sesamum radiatum TaxID=300843 RepID=A0AAW2S9L4_SESRA